MTNFWEQLGRKNAKEASEYESGQAIKIASAAAKTPTLEHYVWSTLPATAQISKGKHFVPHSMLRMTFLFWRMVNNRISGTQSSNRSVHPRQVARASKEDDLPVGIVVCGQHGIHAVD